MAIIKSMSNKPTMMDKIKQGLEETGKDIKAGAEVAGAMVKTGAKRVFGDDSPTELSPETKKRWEDNAKKNKVK